jgi:hypothetical protein
VRPDRTYEGEAGLDLAIAPGAARISITAYRRREAHRGAYLGYYGPTAYGGYGYGPIPLGTLRRIVNGLEIENAFVPVARENLRLETNFALTLQSDRVRSDAFGPFAWVPGRAGYLGSLSMVHGRSLGGWQSRSYTYEDTNGDGVLDNMLFAPASDIGRSRPSRIASLDARLTIARRWTLAADLGYMGGHKVLDKVESLRCRVMVCEAFQSASLADQAHALATGAPEYFVSGDALRVRELSLTYGAPALARLSHANGTHITVAVRNAATFSHARYQDPETELPLPGIDGDPIQNPGLALARSVSLRFALSY